MLVRSDLLFRKRQKTNLIRKKENKRKFKIFIRSFSGTPEMVGQKHCRAIIRRVGKPDSSQELKYLVYIIRMPSI